MQQIRDFLNLVDYLFATLWGYTLIDLIPHLSTSYVFSSIDNVIKSLFALVGLIYASVRCYFYYKRGIRANARAILEEQKLAQEIENNRVDFYKKFNNEFLKDSKYENNTNRTESN